MTARSAGDAVHDDLMRQVRRRIRACRLDVPEREIERVVAECRADLDIVPFDALAELVERLALQRLADRHGDRFGRAEPAGR